MLLTHGQQSRTRGHRRDRCRDASGDAGRLVDTGMNREDVGHTTVDPSRLVSPPVSFNSTPDIRSRLSASSPVFRKLFVIRERKKTCNVGNVALDPGSCTARDSPPLRRSAGAFHFGPARTCRVPPAARREPSVSSHSADRTSSGIVGVAAPALAATMAALPGFSAARSDDDLTTTAARNCPATSDDAHDAHDADNVTREVPSVSGAYIYGYDTAGNPTLSDVGYSGISDGELPD